MAERLRKLTDPELQTALLDLGRQLAYPATPNLARAVGNRLRARPARRTWAWAPLFAPRRELALALAAVVLVVGAALAFPPTRHAIADRLGLRGVEIKTTQSPLPSLTPAPERTRLQLGQRVTLREAQGRVRYQVLQPTLSDLGSPDEVYFTEPPVGGQVALVYLARPGYPRDAQTGVSVLLTQFRGAVGRDAFAKSIGPGTRLDSVTVNGGAGFWIEGAPHLFYFYRDANGQSANAEARLAGNVLLWQQGELTLRLEGVANKDQALRIAQSVR